MGYDETMSFLVIPKMTKSDWAPLIGSIDIYVNVCITNCIFKMDILYCESI